MNVVIWILWIFKTDWFKIRKHSWILGYFQIRKIRILNLRLGTTLRTRTDSESKIAYYCWRESLVKIRRHTRTENLGIRTSLEAKRRRSDDVIRTAANFKGGHTGSSPPVFGVPRRRQDNSCGSPVRQEIVATATHDGYVPTSWMTMSHSR